MSLRVREETSLGSNDTARTSVVPIGRRVRPEESRLEQLLLRISDVVRITSLSRAKIYDLISRGELRSVTCGRARRVPVDALKEWLDDRLAESGRGGGRVGSEPLSSVSRR